MKLILLFLTLYTLAFSKNIDISKYYYIDNNSTFTIDKIMKDKTIFEPIKKYGLGIIDESIWIHIPINNNTNTLYKKRIYHKRAGIDFIDVYIVKNHKIIKTFKLGDMTEYKDRDNVFRVPYFDIKIAKYENIDIFIKQKSYSSMDIRWNIEDIEAFDNYYDTQAIVYTFISGLLTVTILASLVLYSFLKNKFYLIYSSFTTGILLYQLALAGYFYQFQLPLHLITYFNFPIPMIILVLLSLFPFYFFDIKKNEFTITVFILKAFIILLLLSILLELFFPLNYNILYISNYTIPLGFLTIFTLLTLSIQIFIAKKRDSTLYLLANIVQFLFITSYILVMAGVMKYHEFYYYTLAIGSIGQDLFLLLALIHSTYLIKKDNDKNQELLNEYSKLSFIGQTMVNISHQWKTPINNIYNSINHIEIAKEFKDPNLDTIIDKNLATIKETTIYIKDTALSQFDFYKNDTKKENVNLYDEINFLIKLIENEFNKNSIDIQLKFSKNLTLNIEKNYLLNVLMVLFENSYRVFEERKIDKPHILIQAIIQDNTFELIFEDNAKGVKNDIDKIFDKNHSLDSSTGLGLYLAREIVTHKLKGQIDVKNIKEGISFTIYIP